ncbi:MAG: alpha-amylase family glycosyl hydrolase, partial [Phycisphaerae bacterium]
MRTFQAIVACTLAFSAMPTWAAPLNGRAPIDDVFYMYMPIAWRDSDNDAARFGDFGGMTAALPYLEALGITAIWMNPIFPSPGYHGYQHDAADQINSRFGTEADFLSFVAAAHARGIKVFIDFVVYGISDRSIWYQDAFGNPASVFDDYLAFTNGSNTSFLGSNFTTWNGDSVGFIHWNLNNATVTDMVTTWAERWLDPNIDGNFLDGVDGYRLDHVSAFDPVESPWGYDLAWWIAWHNRIRALNPDVFTFAEQADWGSHGADLLPAFDAAMTKPWEFAARSALANESSNDLYTQMDVTLGTLPAGEMYLATIGDHDVDRIASVIGGSLNKAKSAAAVLLTQPFPPVIYYGDEIGMLGVKQNYGSDANDIPFREPFKWNAVAGPPMSNYWVLNNQAFNNPFSGDNDGRSVEEQDGVPGSLLETYKSLIAARKANSALRVGTYSAVSNSSSAVWAFLRYDATGGQTLLVAINLSGTGVTATLDLTSAGIPGGSTTVQDVITGSFLPLLTDANKAAYGLSLGAYGFAILDVNVIPGQGGPPTGGRDGLNIPGDLGAANLIALQDNETGLGDNVSEANALYLRPTASGIEIGIPGNVQANGTGFVILFDSDPVQGQSQLQTAGMPTPPSAIPPLDGTTFDTGFDPEILIFANAFGGQLFVDRYTLDSAGGGQKRYVGMSVVDSGAAPLSGGSNPNGMELAMNNTNTAGVTDINASGAASASSG